MSIDVRALARRVNPRADDAADTTATPPADLHAPAPFKPALQEIDGNLTWDGKHLTAWFTLGAQPWACRSDASNQATIEATEKALTRLTGLGQIHYRVSPQPFSAYQWAQAIDANTPDPVNPQAWTDFLVRSQQEMNDGGDSVSHTYVGVPVADAKTIDRLADAARRPNAAARVAKRVQAAIRDVSDYLAQPGLSGTPCTQREVESLRQRSLGLLLPPAYEPATTGPVTDDTAAADTVDVYPYPRCLRIVGAPGTYGTDPVERFVAILTVGRCDTLYTPGMHEPWMAYAQRLPFRVEWSSRFDVLSGADAKALVTNKINLIRDNVEQYREHDLDLPEGLEETDAHARRIRGEMLHGDAVTRTRIHGYHRLAVAGRTEEECLDHARRVALHYANLNMEIEHPAAQFALWQEFHLGGRVRLHGYKRHFPVRYFAAAVPNIATTVGDRQGLPLGFFGGLARGVVTWDPHLRIVVHESPGLTPIIAQPGGGKSTLLAALAYGATMQRTCTTLLDPSVTLAGITRIPDIAHVSKHIDLLKGPDGILSPFTAIPMPTKDALREDPDVLRLPVSEQADAAEKLWHDQRNTVLGARRALAADVLSMCLNPGLRRRDGTRTHLMTAVAQTGGRDTSDLHTVIRYLDGTGDPDARMIAAHLREMATFSLARLFFGAGYAVQDDDALTDPTLLVLTMAGLDLPQEGTAEDSWSIGEQFAVPLLHLAANYTTRRVYGRRMSEHKVVGLDEFHFFRRSPSGRNLTDRLTRDSRKWRARILAATQLPSDSISGAGLVSEAFIGRIEDAEVAADALRLARIPTGVGFEQAVMNLSPTDARNPGRLPYRDFLFRHGENADRIRVDLRGFMPDVLAAITPPTPSGSPTGQYKVIL